MGRGRPGTGVEALAASIRVSFTWRGERRRENLDLPPTPPNLKYATRLVRDIKAKILAGTFDYVTFFPDSKQTTTGATFREFADKWLTLQTLAHSSRHSYQYSLKLWEQEFGDKRLTLITVEDIKRFIAKRVESGVSVRTINNGLDPVRGLFAFAVETGALGANPMASVKRLKGMKAQPDPFSKTEMERVLGWMQARAPDDVYAWYVVAFTTGLRPSEQRALRWDDMRGSSQLSIERAIVRDQLKGTKTHQVRYVDLSPRAVAGLNGLTCDDEYIFANADLRPLTDANLFRWSERFWRPCLVELGIRYRSPHHTRHTYATVSLMAGVNPGYVARQLGHTTTRLLFSTYSRWLDGADGGAERAKMEAAFVHDLSTDTGEA